MNPLNAREKTLDELMTELKSRLGFASQGSGSKLVDPILKSFLQEGQSYVYSQLAGHLARKRTEILLVPGSKLYDFHNDLEDQDIDPDFIDSIEVYETENSPIELTQGITEHMRANNPDRAVPVRYDILNGQIELLPVPDQAYKMVVHYREGPARLTQADDRPSVPSQLVFLFALASAKAHYGQQDAQTAGQLFQTMLRQVKARQHMHRRYFSGERHMDTRYFVKRTQDGRYVL